MLNTATDEDAIDLANTAKGKKELGSSRYRVRFSPVGGYIERISIKVVSLCTTQKVSRSGAVAS